VPGRHAGRVVAIAGGVGGVGQGIVQRLAGEGARVASADLSDAAETLELARQASVEAAGYQVDVSEW
jgi:3-oxoacyl-[acyl-carrier protein] reductase